MDGMVEVDQSLTTAIVHQADQPGVRGYSDAARALDNANNSFRETEAVPLNWDTSSGDLDWGAILPPILLTVAVVVAVVVFLVTRARKGSRKPATGVPVSSSSAAVQGQFCPKCGAHVRPGAAFCSSCGAKLK